MKKILDRWWVFVCWGIAIFMVSMFIIIYLNVTIDGKSYMKKVGKNVHPMIQNIKIHADGKEYEVVIIDGYFRKQFYINEKANLKERLTQGVANIEYYLLKKGTKPLPEDHKLWGLVATIPVKRDSIFSEYHIDGKKTNEDPFYSWVFDSVIHEFLEDYLKNKDIERITEFRGEDIKKEEFKHESNIVFTDDGELKEEGELLISFITSNYKGKIKVTARLVIESVLGEKNIYITTEIM